MNHIFNFVKFTRKNLFVDKFCKKIKNRNIHV